MNLPTASGLPFFNNLNGVDRFSLSRPLIRFQWLARRIVNPRAPGEPFTPRYQPMNRTTVYTAIRLRLCAFRFRSVHINLGQTGAENDLRLLV